MDAEDDGSDKKKIDKPDNLAVSEKVESKKCEKSETEDPKPRIVLTFRSEKSNTKTTNMKIVSSEDKLEEVSPRRSGRTRGKWDWVCDSDNSVSPKKDKSQPASENDESDHSHTPPKRTRWRSKDENIIATAIARKERSYNEALPDPPRRRIKPTAKILANKELGIGLKPQINARPSIQTDKTPEEGVRTRRSARPPNKDDKPKSVKSLSEPLEVVELDTDSQNSDMKLEHLCKLGLKAIDPDDAEDSESKEMDENEAEMLEEEEEEVDDDSEVISKLLEADEDSGSDDDFLCSLNTTSIRQDGPPRRSTRLYSSYGNNDSDGSSAALDEEASTSSKAPARRSSRRAAPHPHEDGDRSHRSRRKKRASVDEEEEERHGEESDTAGGDEGSEAACPTEKSEVVVTCHCEQPSNMYAAPEDLTEPVFCQAIEVVEGVRVGCSHGARRGPGGALAALRRAGARAPYLLLCALHAAQLHQHMCCPACGLFCTQGVFYQCSKGHLFHLDCGIPHDVSKSKSKPGCPHCGVSWHKFQPANVDVAKVKLEMKCSNKRIFLPDQREQCTPAYLSFKSDPLEGDPSPVIPEDLLPSAKELKLLFEKPAPNAKASALALADAIIARESIEQLIPKLGTSINKPLKGQDGGTCLHVAARCGHLGAAYLLHGAGADLNATDASLRTPLMAAVLALLDKLPEKTKEVKSDKDDEEVDACEQEVDTEIDDKEGDGKTEVGPKDEDLLKVIRFLVAAGCDVNLPLQDAMTPLHVSAECGSAAAAAALLRAPDVRVDARDQGGWTPLVWAAENNHEQVVRLLLSAGADAGTVDAEGNSAAHWCALAGAGAALRALLHAAPRLAARANAHADTPLHVAARQGHYACVVMLLARGAKSDVENAAGELPIDVSSGPSQSAIALNMQMAIALKGTLAPYKILCSDISNGREQFPIPCVNEVDDEPAPADFTYVTEHVTPEPVPVDTSLRNMQGCTCTGPCNTGSCACAVLSVRDWWRDGRLLPSFPYADPPMLFDCGPTCACNKKQCSNSVVSRLAARGATFARCAAYRAGGARGWGLRAAGGVARGAPVALYAGELLPLRAADARPDDSYMFALDLKRDLLEQCSDKTLLCVDARRFGSAARFVNHACAPSLAPVRVFTGARDLRLPHVLLVALRDIQPGEPFTFDYGDKFWSVKSKWMKCECGSPDCRYPTKAEDTDAQT